MEPNTGTPGAGTPAPSTTPSSAAASPPVSPPPPASPPPAPTPGTGSGVSGAAPASGAPAPASGVAPAPTPAAPANPFAGLSPQQQAQIAEWQRQAQQFQQFQPLIQMGYQAYQRGLSGGQPAAPAQPAGPAQPGNPWGIPQLDRNLLNYVTRNPQTGLLENLPGAPPDAAARVTEYQQKLQDVQWKLFNDPMSLLGPLIEQQAKKLFDTSFTERYGQVQQTQAAQSVIQENRDWLFERDAAGREVRDFDPSTGGTRPRLSPWGRYYAQMVQQADSFGVKDPTAQHQWAVAQVQNAIFQARFQQQQAGQQGQQQQQQFLNQAAVAPPGVVTPPAQVVPQAQPAAGAGGQSLRERMNQAFAANGLTPQVVEQQFARPGA